MKKIYLFAILLFIISCKKEEQKRTTCIALDPGLEKAFHFNKGSYWIYKDSTNGLIDSVVVVKYVRDSGLANGYLSSRYSECYHRAFITCNVYHDGSLSSDTLVWSLYRWYAFNNTNKFTQVEIAPFLYYPVVLESRHYNIDSYTVRNVFPTYHIQGNNYFKVFEVNHRHDVRPLYDDTYNFVDGIGLVKMQLKRRQYSGTALVDSTHSTYELVRYQIHH